MKNSHQHDTQPASFWRSRYGVGLMVLGSVAGYFLWTEHRAHLVGALPYILLSACLLVHLFMHHGHGHGGHQHHGGEGHSGADGEPKTQSPRSGASRDA